MSIKAIKFNKMKTRCYNVVGVMSGTSCDGVDLAHCQFNISEENKWSYSIFEAKTVPYDSAWHKRLTESVQMDPNGIHELNRAYTALLNEIILAFIRDCGLSNLDLVCSHGHTVWHKPNERVTLQIGNLESIAQGMPCPVVCDFRAQDVALGGQGAPLVPIGDQLLFSDYDACLNLGGFANISHQEPGGRTIAYDLSPFNIVLNYWANKLGLDYDFNGDFARSGSVNQQVQHQLNTLSYYHLSPPKSLGLEWVQSNFYPLYTTYELSPEDWLATAAVHMAEQIQRATHSFERVLVTGGGAYNGFVMDQLDELSAGKFIVPNPDLINYKEALIFGLLGVLRWRNEINCLSSVTGARENHSSGVIWSA
jgi:anhydro-N-acetylmuramic acid kinase